MSEVPPIFHSLETDKPFTHCLTCERTLDELDVPYSISKAFKGTECVFEYAMCQDCRADTYMSFSEESRKTLAEFNQNLLKSIPATSTDHLELHPEWMKSCLNCHTPASEIPDYQIACLAFSGIMMLDPPPLMFCSPCEQKLQEKLSKASRDEWDKFIHTNFDGPPADALTPTGGVPVMV